MHPARDSDRRRDIWPPHEVKHVTGLFLELVDEALPGLVEGLYLHGSLGFGEWYPARSDIDFVAVTADRMSPAAVRTLRDVHARLGETFPRPPFDGSHVTWSDLARSPYDCPDVPGIIGGSWRDEGRVDISPVTWHELARHGVRIRGPLLEDVDVWTDEHVLREHSHLNLQEYWARELAELRRFPDEAAKVDIVSWFVLGIPRLHHLLATGRLTSKNGAGQHAVDAFGERWRPVVTEALVYRATGEATGAYDGRADRLAADVVELSALAIDAGLALGPRG
jgi:hypothetical protein